MALSTCTCRAFKISGQVHSFFSEQWAFAYLVDRIFSLLSVHFRDVNDLHDVRLTVGYRLHLHCVAEATLANYFEFSVPVHVFYF